MVTLRRLTEDDSDFLFSWANDPAVIEGSFLRSSEITPDNHQRWFQEKISDPSCFLYIVFDKKEQRVGQVRFDIVAEAPNEAFISIGIAPAFRCKGHAAEAIEEGTDKIFKETRVALVHAYIQPNNIGSQKAFTRAGYTTGGLNTYKAVPAVYMFKIKP